MLPLALIGGSAEVRQHGETYFRTRIWSAPFALCNFALMGWFIGQGKARLTFVIQLVLNLTNMGLSALFVLHYNLEVFGVGLAAVLAEATATVLGAFIVLRQLRRFGVKPSRDCIFDRAKLMGTLKSNTDIMIRTLLLVAAFRLVRLARRALWRCHRRGQRHICSTCLSLPPI